MHIGGENTKLNFKVTGVNGEETLQETTREKDLVWAENNLKSATQSGKAAESGMKALTMIRRTFESLDKDNLMILYRSFVRPHLEYAVQAWSLYLRKDINTLENIQRRATRMVRGMKNLTYKERLDKLGMTTLEERRLRDLIETFKIINNIDKVDKDKFFKSATTINLRGHKDKLFKPQVRSQIRANFFSYRVITYWNKLPEHVIRSTSVNSFKKRLDSCWKKIWVTYPANT